MKQLLSFACAIAVSVALSSISNADILDNSGAGFGIPDNDPAGASSSIVIGANEVITGDVQITLFGSSHTWVGDLNVSISDGTTTADLIFRTGQVGGVGAGDSSDLGGDYTFGDGGADWWAAATAAGGAEVIPPGFYEATTVDGAPVSFDVLFAGASTNAIWTLTISDNASGDTGSIQGWGISASSVPIPEPGSLALLGALGVACVIRRRR